MKEITSKTISSGSLTSGIYLDRGDAFDVRISVGAGQIVDYFFFPSQGVVRREFDIATGARMRLMGVILGTNIESQLSFIIRGTDIVASMDILAIATSLSRISLEGIAKVELGSKQVEVRVDQTNILIGSGAIVRGMPVLQVATDDVVGGHSLKIHRIEGENLFYLESRGLRRDEARTMLLDAEIQKRLSIMTEESERSKIYTEISERIQ